MQSNILSANAYLAPLGSSPSQFAADVKALSGCQAFRTSCTAVRSRALVHAGIWFGTSFDDDRAVVLEVVDFRNQTGLRVR